MGPTCMKHVDVLAMVLCTSERFHLDLIQGAFKSVLCMYACQAILAFQVRAKLDMGSCATHCLLLGCLTNDAQVAPNSLDTIVPIPSHADDISSCLIRHQACNSGSMFCSCFVLKRFFWSVCLKPRLQSQ